MKAENKAWLKRFGKNFAIGFAIGAAIGMAVNNAYISGFQAGFKKGELDGVNTLLLNGFVKWSDGFPVTHNGKLISGDANYFKKVG